MFLAQIILKKGGQVIHQEAERFERHAAADLWMKNREAELRKPGGLDKREDPPLGFVIERYIRESKKVIGRSKLQVLNTVKDRSVLKDMKCSRITSKELKQFLQSLDDIQPSTRQNYLSHLGRVFKVAGPSWGYPLDYKTIADTFVATNEHGLTGKSASRERRPTIDELNRLMDHFVAAKERRPNAIPMHKIVPFAIFSTRRQEEITTLAWDDYEKDRILVRNMKHPTKKEGNDTWCEVLPEAAAFIEAQPKRGPLIFPYKPASIGDAFHRACLYLGINTEDMPSIKRLHFHSLRHDGISRLFELGRTIPQASSVSGHKSWSSLQRYTHIRQTGDKYAKWKWRTPQ